MPVTVTLPDGKPLELPDGATGADAAAAIGPGLARAALAVEVSHPGGRRGAARCAISRARCPTARGWRSSPRRAGEGPRADQARRRARARDSRDGAVRGREDLDRPADRGRLLLRLRVSRRDGGLRGGLPQDRRAHARARQGGGGVRARGRARRAGARALPGGGPGLQGRADRRPRGATPMPAEPLETVSLYTNGPFTDLCRGPHAPSTKTVGAFKLQSVAGAYWRGDSTQDDADAHLRDRVLLEGRARGAPRADRAGEGARPPQARARARSVHVLRALARQPRSGSRRARACGTRSSSSGAQMDRGARLSAR